MTLTLNSVLILTLTEVSFTSIEADLTFHSTPSSHKAGIHQLKSELENNNTI